MVQTTPYILFVDDDADDRELIQLCCEELNFVSRVQFLADAESLFDFLRSLTEPERYPSLLVLDVNMPGVSGEEALLCLKRDKRYRSIPVVMLSTANQRPEYFTGIGAHAFYTKPNQYQQFKSVIANLYGMLTGQRHTTASSKW